MKDPVPPKTDRSIRSSPWVWIIGATFLLIVLMAILLPRAEKHSPGSPGPGDSAKAGTRKTSTDGARTSSHGRGSSAGPRRTAEEIVAEKVSRFASIRRATLNAMAEHFKVQVPDEVKRFFDAVEAGRWEELDAIFQSLFQRKKAEPPSHDLDVLWPAILETYGVAEQAHLWPAQKLLDYGDATLGVLRPGMVFVGGTDPGRFIPTLLNETGNGEHRIVLTQNALADPAYLDYIGFLYGDRMTALTQNDRERATQEYLADYQKRLAHDQEFPDEPRQVRPGENVVTKDGQAKPEGGNAIMAVNELLFQTILKNNPELSFALEESFPFKSTYADATPLGPLMEIRAQDGPTAFTPERAAQSVDYWRATTQQLLADPESAKSNPTLMAWSKMVSGQGELLLNHKYATEAEQAFQLAIQLCPYSPEGVFKYVNLLVGQKRVDDAIRVAANGLKAKPEDENLQGLVRNLQRLKEQQQRQ